MNPTLDMTIEPTDRDWFRLELADAWRAAHAEAILAYEYWREERSPMAYAVYRARVGMADRNLLGRTDPAGRRTEPASCFSAAEWRSPAPA